MWKKSLFWGIVAALAVVIFYQFSQIQPPKRLWGTAISPDGLWKVKIYKRKRLMHQCPEILLFQLQGKTETEIQNIELPEDDRSEFKYGLDWIGEKEAIFTIFCHNCMEDTRHYQIWLGEQPRAQRLVDPLPPNLSNSQEANYN